MHCRQRCADLVLWHVQDISMRERANIYAVGDDSDFEFTHLITIPAGILLASEWSCGLRRVVAANGQQSARSRDCGGASQNVSSRDLVHEFSPGLVLHSVPIIDFSIATEKMTSAATVRDLTTAKPWAGSDVSFSLQSKTMKLTQVPSAASTTKSVLEQRSI